MGQNMQVLPESLSPMVVMWHRMQRWYWYSDAGSGSFVIRDPSESGYLENSGGGNLAGL
jgi:hypothetical protein